MTETTKHNGEFLDKDTEMKNLRIQLKAHNDELHELRKKFLYEQNSNIKLAQRQNFLEEKYNKALEELVYREEYFKLYESKFIKYVTKILMKIKKLKGKLKSYVQKTKI